MTGTISKIKKFFYKSSVLISTTLKLNSFLRKDFKKYIIILYTAFVFDVLFRFISRGSQALIVNILTDYASGKKLASNALLIIAVILVVSLVVPDFINIIISFYRRITYRKIDETVGLAFIDKKARLDISQLENPEKSNLFQRVMENLFRFRQFFSNQFDIFGSLFNVVTILVSLLFIKPWISIIILIFSLPELYVETKAGRVVWTIDMLGGEIKRKYNNLKSYFGGLNSIVDIKLSGSISYFTNRLRNIINPFLEDQYKADKKRHIGVAFATIISKSGIIICAIWLIYDVIHGNMKIGTFVFAYSLITSFQSSLSWFFRLSASQYEDNHYVDDFFEVMEMKGELKYIKNPIKLPIGDTPTIEFKNINFHYPEKEKTIIDNISLKIKPGEKIAIVGVNGAGKSTLVKLLCRFYDVTDGEILIDGNNIKDLDIKTRWNHIGYMPQDASNYLFTVKESIGIGKTNEPLDLTRVKKAAKMSLAEEFIKNFKNGYDQQLGRFFDDGESLSGGQWQKMNLARIFYRDPQIYILDEPTSALDAEAEIKIFENLSKLPKDKTVIFISHRFSTIRQADKICVIEDGRIGEIGTHEELIKNNGNYKRLFNLQAEGYK